MNKIKVFFILPTLYGGGAERVVSYIPQFIDKEKFDVKLIVVGLEKDSTYDVFGIPVQFLNKKRVLNGIIPLFRLLAKEKPKVVLSTISHLNVLMGYNSALLPKTKFIGRHTIVSQTAIDLSTKKETYISRLKTKLYKKGMNLLDIVLCQSVDMYDDMQVNYFEIDKDKLRIIHNPMRDKFSLKTKKHNSGNGITRFITVARLVPMKGYARILDSISKLDYPFQYTIVGDGREKEKIFNKVKELGLQDKVTHVPFTSEVSKHLSESDYYLMGSYAEGFPNCLIESCSVGTPVIAFKAPGGLNEIIEDGTNGYLVDTETEFVEKLNLPYNWKTKDIRESVHKKFNLNKIINDYENLFLEVLN